MESENVLIQHMGDVMCQKYCGKEESITYRR